MSLGPTEIIVVLLVALVVLGPDKLPTAARTFGKYLAEFRKFSSAVQSQVDDALKMAEDKAHATNTDGAGSGEPDDNTEHHSAGPKPDNPDTSGFTLIDEKLPVTPPPIDPGPPDEEPKSVDQSSPGSQDTGK